MPLFHIGQRVRVKQVFGGADLVGPGEPDNTPLWIVDSLQGRKPGDPEGVQRYGVAYGPWFQSYLESELEEV